MIVRSSDNPDRKKNISQQLYDDIRSSPRLPLRRKLHSQKYLLLRLDSLYKNICSVTLLQKNTIDCMQFNMFSSPAERDFAPGPEAIKSPSKSNTPISVGKQTWHRGRLPQLLTPTEGESGTGSVFSQEAPDLLCSTGRAPVPAQPSSHKPAAFGPVKVRAPQKLVLRSPPPPRSLAPRHPPGLGRYQYK